MRKEFYREDGEGELRCEDVAVREVADEVPTPFYLYSHGAIRAGLTEYQEELVEHGGTVAYALKANSSRALLGIVEREGAGADVTSRGELYRALEAGIPAGRVVFAGVGKKRDEIRAALEEGILGLNVESLDELELIEEVSTATGKRAPVAIRVKPEVGSEAHPYLSTGDSSTKFGVSRNKALKGFERVRSSSHLEPVGLHAHIGSQVGSAAPYEETASFLGELVEELSGRGIELDYVDFGGGFGVPGGLEESGTNPSAGDFVSAILDGFGERKEDYRLLVEPGRSVAAPGGVLVGEVVRRKTTEGGKTYLVTDVGMNDFVRPALYGAEHEPVPLELGPEDGDREAVDVVGPLCESGDFLARGRELPRMEGGDRFALLDAGAYGMSMASNYNSRPRGAEVMVKGDDYQVVRKRERLEDLVEKERRPSFL